MFWTATAIILLTAFLVVVAMNFVTPEKKIERKVEHAYAIAEPQFRREMSVLLGPAIIGGNDVVALQNGDEIFPAMLEEIRRARRTVNFETYIYWSGEIGKEFAEALSERARAGVAVHVTVDWAGSFKMENDLLEQMRSAGVRIERYRPLYWFNLGRLNNRTHRKLLVVDGCVGFTGGVGIADQWTGHAQDPGHWRDSHFRVSGPVAAQLQAAFNDNWIKMTGELLAGEDYFPHVEPTGALDAHLFISSPAGGSESMHLMYLMAIAAAVRSIDLSAAYFVPDGLIVKALLAARERGARVRILLPGEHIDSETVKRASKATWGELLRAGVEMHIYEPTMIHVKMFVADGEFVSVGSTNFDMRSFGLNDEASLNVYSRDFAEQVTRVFESDLARAQRYTYEAWRARPMRDKLAERLLVPIRSQL